MFIRVVQVCAAWAAYSERRIRLIDLRVWFACWELTARRCRLAAGRTPNYSPDELHGLSRAEADTFLRLFEVRGMVASDGTSVTNSGHGPFRVALLRRGERFIDGLGRDGVVTHVGPDSVAVMLYPRSMRATRMEFPRSLTVYVADARHAEAVRKRLARAVVATV